MCRKLDNGTPSFVDDIFIHSENERVLYLNPNAPDWITIKQNYKPIFDLINNENSKKSIYSFIKNSYASEKEILTLQMKKLFSTSNIFKQNYKNKSLSKKEKSLPKNIYLSLTDNCNLHCVYCYATERQKHEDTTLGKWQEYVSSIIQFAGKPSFVFTGGEPLTLPYVFELANFIRKKGCELVLLTNGTLITSDNIVNKIAELFSLVKISLDSLDEKITTSIRGHGVVEKVKNVFSKLKSKGCNVQILATVTSKTCNSIKEFTEYFDSEVNYQPFYSMGRAKHESELSITGEQYYNFLTETDKFKYLHDYRNRIHSFRNNPCKRCAMAAKEISIDQKGNVYPCHLLHYPYLQVSSLHDWIC